MKERVTGEQFGSLKCFNGALRHRGRRRASVDENKKCSQRSWFSALCMKQQLQLIHLVLYVASRVIKPHSSCFL